MPPSGRRSAALTNRGPQSKIQSKKTPECSVDREKRFGENRKSGEDPERYRHCKCGSSAGAKAGHWGDPRRLHGAEDAQVRRPAQRCVASPAMGNTSCQRKNGRGESMLGSPRLFDAGPEVCCSSPWRQPRLQAVDCPRTAGTQPPGAGLAQPTPGLHPWKGR